ncbi:amidohydrolase family protein [Leucobacter sp. CSA1]|uniref:Amidohydrolase family protein n=1 Tax=Leucobacter chromiisoli TaxID=2796471 RepID=A0A934QAF4_9MICO|nr:amidohydrolase family protein [Leucobacter chromiisoli]MBK0420136.1 amidohydrolase family protein [Leucobacter chromiisoli]
MTRRLFSGGEIVTLTAESGDAVLVEHGRILAVGERERLLGGPAGPAGSAGDVEEIDLGGAALIPGFVDGHAHLELSCITQEQHLQLHAPPVASLTEILDAVARRRAEQGRGWIVVRSSFALDRRVAEGRLLEREELDRASPGEPVAVLAGLHVASLNTAAMRLLGLDDEASHASGMTVHRRADGSPSGVFTEIWDLLPTATVEESRSALERHARRLFGAHGITSLSTISTSASDVRALQELAEAGTLPFRVRFHPHVPRFGSMEEVLSLGIASGFGDDMLRFGGVKIFVDGEGGDGLGRSFDDLKWTQEELDDVVGRATVAGVQLFMHAVTETGILAAIAAVRRQDGADLARLPAPHRIEHSGDYVPVERIGELAASGVGVVTTPHFVSSDVVERDFQPLRRLVDAGIRIIGATDTTGTVPEGASPLANIASMVNRVDDLGGPSPHRLSAEEALRAFTDWSARGQGEGGVKGVLRRGAHADFAILSENPLSAPPERLAGIEVLGTVVGGDPA